MYNYDLGRTPSPWPPAVCDWSRQWLSNCSWLGEICLIVGFLPERFNGSWNTRNTAKRWSQILRFVSQCLEMTFQAIHRNHYSRCFRKSAVNPIGLFCSLLGSERFKSWWRNIESMNELTLFWVFLMSLSLLKKIYIEKPQMIDPHKGGPSFTPRFCVSSEFWLVEVETVAGRGSAGPGCDSVPVARRLPRWRHRPFFSKGGF